jgi:hypothetical protein
MVLNSLVFGDFGPVFDQKLEMGVFTKEIEICARRDFHIFNDS